MITAVFFDVGGTLVDEAYEFAGWADWLGVPRHTMSAVLGGVIARGRDFREVFETFRPGFDMATEYALREAAGAVESFGEEDLYPDARECLATLKAQGLRVGIAGNQPVRAEGLLRDLGLAADVIATSEGWGAVKPDPAFFAHVICEGGGDPSTILYVGDRPDNDVRPAVAAGMKAALVRRGPWGYVLEMPEAAALAEFRIAGLDELPELVAKHNAGSLVDGR